jgi:hypothetical protein
MDAVERRNNDWLFAVFACLQPCIHSGTAIRALYINNFRCHVLTPRRMVVFKITSPYRFLDALIL